VKTAALSTIFAAAAAIAAVYAWALIAGAPPPWAPWVVAVAAPLAMIATAAAAVTRRDARIPPLLAAAFALTLVLLVGGFVLALVLPSTDEPLLLGLPRRAAVVLYGVGLLPVLILPVAYAMTFDESALSEEALARLRSSRALSHTADGPVEPVRVPE
jgi:hypothetical protein